MELELFQLTDAEADPWEWRKLSKAHAVPEAIFDLMSAACRHWGGGVIEARRPNGTPVARMAFELFDGD
jgi:hypothetical protein